MIEVTITPLKGGHSASFDADLRDAFRQFSDAVIKACGLGYEVTFRADFKPIHAVTQSEYGPTLAWPNGTEIRMGGPVGMEVRKRGQAWPSD